MIIKINKNQEGLRLDKFLFAKYKNSNITDIKKFIRKKEIKINGRKTEENYIVKNNDEIVFGDFVEKILINPVKINNTVKNNNIDVIHNRLITENIIFQNDNLLVINKKSGLSVQGGSGIAVSIDKILKNLNDENSNLKLVHRLDKDTSGVLLIAKNIETANALTEMFKNKKHIVKEYLLFVYNNLKNKKGVINLPLLKKYNNNVEKVYVDRENGKEAITEYEVLSYSKQYNVSFVKARILTGRTHQIRVHFKELGCPVVGDFKYGGKQKNDNLNLQKKLFLHSWKTKLTLFGEDYEFLAPLPSYMEELRKRIEIEMIKK